jgi:hypothetical protein
LKAAHKIKVEQNRDEIRRMEILRRKNKWRRKNRKSAGQNYFSATDQSGKSQRRLAETNNVPAAAEKSLRSAVL